MTYSFEVRKQGKQLKFARECRGYSQSELCKNAKGLSQPNLSRFEKGQINLSEKVKRDTMEFLKWPFYFLYEKVSDIEIISKHYKTK